MPSGRCPTTSKSSPKRLAEKPATGRYGFYSDRKLNVVAASFLSQIYWTWGVFAHEGRARLVLNRRCLVEVPNAPHHCAERAHAEAEYDKETAFDSHLNPEAGHCTGPGDTTDA